MIQSTMLQASPTYSEQLRKNLFLVTDQVSDHSRRLQIDKQNKQRIPERCASPLIWSPQYLNYLLAMQNCGTLVCTKLKQTAREMCGHRPTTQFWQYTLFDELISSWLLGPRLMTLNHTSWATANLKPRTTANCSVQKKLRYPTCTRPHTLLIDVCPDCVDQCSILTLKSLSNIRNDPLAFPASSPSVLIWGS